MADSRVNQDEFLTIKDSLLDTKSSKRRSAAKKIGKKKIVALGDDLYSAYIKEKKDMRTWETQADMIWSLGKINFKKIIPELENIISENKIHDQITTISALSYVRLMRVNINDATPVIKLLKKGNLSVIDGALAALAYDDMVPSDEQIMQIISTINENKEDELTFIGILDPRSFLISAMSKWDENLVSDYIRKYIDHPRLKEYALKALNREKSRYE